MTTISLNITGKIDPATVAIFDAVSGLANELAMNYVVVGATARDMVLHHGHGAKIRSATLDVDFAIEVPGWAAFEAIKRGLHEQGFQDSRDPQRLVSPQGVRVDIVPFGAVEDASSSIAWPPKGDVVMNMLGFQEACDSAEWVRIQENPELDIPVVTPIGMTLLKLVAWTDREIDKRRRDAQDLAYLLRNYEMIPAVSEALYGEESALMEQYGWDMTQASAHLLGQRAGELASNNTRALIAQLANDELASDPLQSLLDEMCNNLAVELDRNRQLLEAYLRGFGVTSNTPIK